jgi:hypothetical protein
MIKPTMPNIPGMGAMTDTLEFVKNLWGGMNVPGAGIPGMVMPTLSVEDINKQIADLRAVESWLNVNMNMLRASIQALEVQSATISTLQSMGESFNSAVKANTETAAGAVRAATSAANVPSSAGARHAHTAGKSAASAAADDEQAEKRRNARDELKEEFTSGTAQESAKESTRESAKPAASPAAGSDFTAPLANPAIWWNMLQDQFKQAVGNAMAAEPEKPAPRKAKGGKSAAKSAAKGAAAKRKPNIKSL